MNFSERVKAIKKEKGITNEMLAAASGIPTGTLGKLLSGFTEEPKLSTAVAIASALGCSLEYLALGQDSLCLTKEESALIEKRRTLDTHGLRICDYILDEEYMRCSAAARNVRAEIPETIFRSRTKVKNREKTRIIPLYADRVSAGSGIYLESSSASAIRIADNEKTKEADFALCVSGNSMEPRFSDGDILLVRSAAVVDPGELGIFVCDGEGYFKKFGGDCLLSLNPDYAPIPISAFTEFACRGHVLGSLRAKK